jgi:SagB-type dehydrogenase family enzyme
MAKFSAIIYGVVSKLVVSSFRTEKRTSGLFALLVTGLFFLSCTSSASTPSSDPATPQYPIIKLPSPKLRGEMSLEETLLQRRSVRDYAQGSLRLEEVSQLLWAAQGKTAEWGGRTAPSAGALYPLETYLIVGSVQSLSAGIYKYNPEKHELVKVRDGDVREQLGIASLGQTCVKVGAISIVITAFYERTTGKYGERGVRYVHMEVGHVAQNVCLQATALNLGAVTIGAFHDGQVKNILGLSENESPLYVIPVGR